MDVGGQEQAEPAGAVQDMDNAHHIDTTGLSVQEWEAIKAAYARDGWRYAPQLMVFLREPDGTTA